MTTPRPKLLFATHIDFWQRRAGSHLRTLALLERLAEHFELTVFYAHHTRNPYPTDLQDLGVAQFHALPRKSWRNLSQRIGPKRVWQELAARFGKAPSLSHFRSAAALRQFGELVDRLQPQVVVISYLRLAFLLDALHSARPQTCLDTHDVMHERYQSFRASGMPHWVRLDAAEEVAVLRRFDAVWTITPDDKEVFRRLDPSLGLYHVGYKPPPVSVDPVESLVFGYIAARSPTNDRTTRFILEKIVPQLPAGSRLLLAGPASVGLKHLPDTVEAIGSVDEIETFFKRISCLLNPVAEGGGLKIKNVDALAHGIPVLTTPLGAQGLDEAVAAGALEVAPLESFGTRVAQFPFETLRSRQAAARAYAGTPLRDELDACLEALSIGQ